MVVTELKKKKGRGKTQRGYISDPRKRYASYRKRAQGFFKCVIKHEENFRSSLKLVVRVADLSKKLREASFRYVTGANDNILPNRTKSYWDETDKETDTLQKERKKGARGPAHKGYIEDYTKRRESMKKRNQGLFLCAMLFAENFRADITLEVKGELKPGKGKPYYYRFVTGATDNILPVFTMEYMKRWIEGHVDTENERDIDEFIKEFGDLLENSSASSSASSSPESASCSTCHEQTCITSSDDNAGMQQQENVQPPVQEQCNVDMGSLAWNPNLTHVGIYRPLYTQHMQYMQPYGMYTQALAYTQQSMTMQGTISPYTPVISLKSNTHEEMQRMEEEQNTSGINASRDDDFDVNMYLNDSCIPSTDRGDDGLSNNEDSSDVEALVNSFWSYERLNSFLLGED